ncbi:MAG TPA: tRNA (N6-threonylcarbamoyladenosine(37)-N6)-methyltransferase TrmO [Syntrophomonadaceae bacterium]|nr:tRNA (N6-threonylcarbamoyladenosine(37)-N6)-methyltransferase TrmO [Syntrophomonadaceae bacterium]HQA07969.1 tRNA (N6-threonylcarbamoyladenosine(37)-N6)-methyltransferase TrmO [Syntrophomonadaceae bacterium]HQE23184.1 tRNA (N6-threonylcarbamoyladenosine(37)-N6)-methyltransferase TrmO [Syntrophomonadaceae bacterium]
MEAISLHPIGYVISPVSEPKDMPPGGVAAEIEVLPQYQPGLLRVEENSHLWIQSWFHMASRDQLIAHPRGNQHLPEYGVFAMRSPGRPNPIALSLTKLIKLENNKLYVERLDAVNGTPVLDIKPYFENDIIFSPRTPYIPGKTRTSHQDTLLRQALAHHQEKCPSLYLAVRMALVADEVFGHLNNPELMINVTGSACLADTIQGLTRARLANPARFFYDFSTSLHQTIWTMNGRGTLTLTWLGNTDIMECADEELFSMDFKLD